MATPALLLIFGLVSIIGGRLLASRASAAETHRRGTQLVPHKRAQRRTPRSSGHCGARPLTIAGVVVDALDETKHFKLIGTTGTGKSTAIRELLGGALVRGDRAIVTDPDGGYLARFYERYRGDVILNPFEPHSVKWDPFAEIRHPYDVEQLVSGLIPLTEDSSAREWRGYARTFLSAITRRCKATSFPG